ncbi:male gametocyte surface protein P230p-like [Haliotis cracherodii]|uniref:male gametocyte surface protein P230p-like n=1 Tax=Haliotis cracherodii TaxID=6455 RepID=UPI0039E866AB
MGWLPRLATGAAIGSTTFLKLCRSGDIKTITEVDSHTLRLSVGSRSTMDISTAFVALARNAKGELKDAMVQKMLVCAGVAAVGGISYLAWRKCGKSITRWLLQNKGDVQENHVQGNLIDVVENHHNVREEDSKYSDDDDDDDDDDDGDGDGEDYDDDDDDDDDDDEESDEESDNDYPDLETYVYGSWGKGDAATMFSDEEIDVPAVPASERRVQRSRMRLVRVGRMRD